MRTHGKGRTTCGYFYPDGKHALYSSTHGAGEACPPRPDYSRGYVWVADLVRQARASKEQQGATAGITHEPAEIDRHR